MPGRHGGNGSQRIAAERLRQKGEKGYDAKHDAGHAEELMLAAACYIIPPDLRYPGGYGPPQRWPWDAGFWKPSDDRIRELEKAGALVAAAIDALLEEQR